jgi:Zn-dependent M28 family amino/carboxypeptidase
MKLRALIIPAGLALAIAASAAVDWQAEGQRWWAHVEYLASDKLEGRNTGSEGYRQAAQYVSDQFARWGLKPAGVSGYLQPVRFDVRQIDEPHSTLELVRDGKAEPLQLGEDAEISMRTTPPGAVEAPAVFVGYGLSIPERNYDDLAGLDLRGKIAVYLIGGPPSIPGPLRAHFQSTAERWKAMKKAGVIGLAAISNPRAMDIPWERAVLARFQPAMDLAEPALKATQGQQLGLFINAAHADKLFQGTGHTIEEILAAADAGKPLPHFPLGASIRAKVAAKQWQVESPNVVGLRPGSDPRLNSEYVVLSAHLDHLGVGLPIHGDAIYNGAMDNASGVASLLEIARALEDSHAHLKRSVLFLAVTGEEKGLLGSKYFTHHPTVPAERIVADINMDMFLPLFPLRYLEVQGLDESTLGDDIRAVAQAAGVEIQADKEPARNLFIRSDQYNFILMGVPALAFKFGYLNGSPEEKISRDWLHNHYHAPSDDASQPVDLAAAAQFNHIILELAERVANDPQRPAWRSDSFFRRFAK